MSNYKKQLGEAAHPSMGKPDPTRTFILFPQPVKGDAPKPRFYYNGSTTPNKDE